MPIAASGRFGEYTKKKNMCIKLSARMVSLFSKPDKAELHGCFDVTVKGAPLIYNVKVNVK